MITDLLRAVIATAFIAIGLAILFDRTRKSYDPLAFLLVAFGVDLLYWSVYYGSAEFPDYVRWLRGIYLGFNTLLALAVAIQQWSLTRKYKKSAKERKMQRAKNRTRALQNDLGTEDPPTNIPDLYDDD